jgi:hypothetical protein
MNALILEMEGTWQEITEKMSTHFDERVHVIVRPVVEEPKADSKRKKRTVREILEETASNIPPEELAKFPADFSSQLDHYIYGTPKQ